MPWSIVIFESDSVFEIKAWSEKSNWTKSWILTSLDKVWRETLEKCGTDSIDKVYFLSNRARHQLRKRHGTSPVIITDAGQEHALEILRPDFPYRDILNPDIIFGLKSQRELEAAELEFITSKIELLNNKAVAIGFSRHSSGNTPEATLTKVLTEKNAKSFSSHLQQGLSEMERLEKTVLQAYLSPIFEEGKAQLRKLMGETTQIFGHHHREWIPLENMTDPLCWLMPETEWQSEEEQLYFGVDQFWRLGSQQEAKKLLVQPTQAWQKGFWNQSDLKTEEQGLEPGPMSFGRGLQPLLLDVWLKVDADLLPEVLRERLQEKFMQRTLEVLLAQSQDRNRGFLAELDQLVATSLFAEWSLNPMARWSGPLAKAAAQCVKRNFTNSRIEILMGSELGLTEIVFQQVTK